MKLTILLLAIFVPAVAVALPTREIAAKEVAMAYLAKIDEGDYRAALAQSAPIMREQLEPSEWENALNQVRTPLGAVQKRSLRKLFFTRLLPGAPDSQYVVVQHETTFSGRADPVSETIITIRVINGKIAPPDAGGEDGQWMVSGYYLR